MKNMPMRLISALALVLMVAFNSCKKDEGVITPQFPELKEVTCEVNDELDITFNANLDWSIQSSAAWCKFVNGEFTETTASGKAGEQTLKIQISDENWNYNTDDVAKLTLKMMDAQQVIYEITRAKREYLDLIIIDDSGNKYDANNPLTIKGSGLRDVTADSVFTIVTATADMQVGIIKKPYWLFVENMGNGVFSFIFNKGNQDIHGKDPIYSFRGGEDDKIVFATKDYIDGNVETDKVRMVEVPVNYEGLKIDYIELSNTYAVPLLVSKDGMKISKNNETNEVVANYMIGTPDFGATVSNVRDNKFRVYVFEKTEFEMDNGTIQYAYDFTKEVDWLTVNLVDNKFTVEQPNMLRSSEPRGAIIMAFSEDFCKLHENDWASVLLDDEGYIKPEYDNNIFASFTQKDTSFGIKGYVKRTTGEMLPFGNEYTWEPGEEPDPFLRALRDTGIYDQGYGQMMISAGEILCQNGNKIYLEIVNYKEEPQLFYEPESLENFTIEIEKMDDKRYIVMSGKLTDSENQRGVILYIGEGEQMKIMAQLQFYK